MSDDAVKLALRKITYGLYVVTSKMDGKFNGLIINTLFQVTSEPPCVSICINRENYTHGFIKESGVFVASVLEEAVPLEFIGIFGFKSGRDTDKLAQVGYELGELGVPIVTDYAVAAIEARVRHAVDVGRHTVFIADVVGARFFKDAEPLTYADYHAIKGGKTPKRAVTYMGERDKEREAVEPGKTEGSREMKKYQCNICGYIYEPEKGDPDGGVAAGTPFEELSDDWVCPVCGADKSEFSPVD